MDYSQTVANLNPDVVKKLKTAIELGRWENEEKLTSEQVESAMQAVMLWEARNVGNKEGVPFAVGAKGELHTGKGGTYEPSLDSITGDDKIIIKNKV